MLGRNCFLDFFFFFFFFSYPLPPPPPSIPWTYLCGKKLVRYWLKCGSDEHEPSW